MIGGHTHEEVDTLIGGTLLTQTGKDLRNIGVTTIRMKGKKVAGVDFRLVPLAGYEPDPVFQKQVDACYANPELNRPMGGFGNAANKWGLANWMAGAVADGIDAEIGFYHIGGVRLDSIPAGGVSAASVYGLEPFGTLVAEMKMTPADMRRMIVSKYNDPVNVKEAHRIDLISTTPYVIVTDQADNALDVEFPKLREGKDLHGSPSAITVYQELQRPELHRRQDYRRGCDRDSARRGWRRTLRSGSTTRRGSGCGGSRPADGTGLRPDGTVVCGRGPATGGKSICGGGSGLRDRSAGKCAGAAAESSGACPRPGGVKNCR